MFLPFPRSSHRRVQTSLSAPFSPSLVSSPIATPSYSVHVFPSNLVSPPTNNIHAKSHLYTNPHRPSIRTPRNSKRDRGARDSEFETGHEVSKEASHGNKFTRHRSRILPPFSPSLAQAMRSWGRNVTKRTRELWLSPRGVGRSFVG